MDTGTLILTESDEEHTLATKNLYNKAKAIVRQAFIDEGKYSNEAAMFYGKNKGCVQSLAWQGFQPAADQT